MRTSIIGTFFMASPAELQEGRQWYSNAAKIAADLRDKYDLPMISAAGIIAALSPQNPWESNIQDSYNVCEAYSVDGKDAALSVECGTFDTNKRKAIAILELGRSATSYEVHRILNGLKVRNFLLSILGDELAVCVDGHAYSIWLGEDGSTKDTPKLMPELYERVAQDYRESTDEINEIMGTDYRPSTVQAITWVVHRNLCQGQRKRKAKRA